MKNLLILFFILLLLTKCTSDKKIYTPFNLSTMSTIDKYELNNSMKLTFLFIVNEM
jgi:hypothetical protein